MRRLPLPNPPEVGRAERAEPHRLAFLDAARCVGVTLMILAHVRDQLMAPASPAGWLRVHDLTRGFTAPLFFMVSGWAFTQVKGPVRYRRLALLFVTGYLLTLPWWADGFPFALPAEMWRAPLAFGVLQCLAAAMLLAYGLRGARVLLPGAGVLCLAAALLGDRVQALTAAWPMALSGALSGQGVSGAFPLAPFAGFFFLGVVLGHVRERWPVAALGAVCVALFFVWPRGGTQLFMLRAGVVMVGLYALSLTVKSLPVLFATVSRHALTFYVGHMVLIWGVPKVPGLAWRLNYSLGPAGVLAVTAAMLGGFSALVMVAKRNGRSLRSARRAEHDEAPSAAPSSATSAP